mmetsp:Transcript_1937/g.3682  ORF Transcript_1937/g.3682 Transcript_1937/m.3682 type:complete len:250 (+) Transcript_1937:90-839(+)
MQCSTFLFPTSSVDVPKSDLHIQGYWRFFQGSHSHRNWNATTITDAARSMRNTRSMHDTMAEEIGGTMTDKRVRCFRGQCSGLFNVDRKTYTTADSRLHAINEITKKHDVLGDLSVLTPHGPLKCTGEDLFLVLLNFIQEGIDRGKSLSIPTLGFMGCAEQLSVQSKEGHHETLAITCSHALVLEAATGEFSVEDMEGICEEVALYRDEGCFFTNAEVHAFRSVAHGVADLLGPAPHSPLVRAKIACVI